MEVGEKEGETNKWCVGGEGGEAIVMHYD